MANRLGIDLAGKKVVMQGEGPEEQRTIQVNEGTDAGFGARPQLRGTALFGVHTSTGEEIRVDGSEVEKLADSSEQNK